MNGKLREYFWVFGIWRISGKIYRVLWMCSLCVQMAGKLCEGYFIVVLLGNFLSHDNPAQLYFTHQKSFIIGIFKIEIFRKLTHLRNFGRFSTRFKINRVLFRKLKFSKCYSGCWWEIAFSINLKNALIIPEKQKIL